MCIKNLKSFNDVIGFQWAEEQVQNPKAEHEGSCGVFVSDRTAQLSADSLVSTQHQHEDGDQRFGAEYCHGECQAVK